jgi:hypothetical protein
MRRLRDRLCARPRYARDSGSVTRSSLWYTGQHVMATSLPDFASYASSIQSALLAGVRAVSAKRPRFVAYRFVRACDPPAIVQLSSKIGFALPMSLENLFTNVAARLEFSWGLTPADDVQMQMPIFAGKLEWDMASIEHLIREKNACQGGTVFESSWSGKLPFMAIGNGDFVAVAQDGSSGDEVYYLTPAEPPSCVMTFKYDLFTFLLDWCRIACVCDASLRQFYDPASKRIDSRGTQALRWRAWLGLDWDEPASGVDDGS